MLIVTYLPPPRNATNNTDDHQSCISNQLITNIEHNKLYNNTLIDITTLYSP